MRIKFDRFEKLEKRDEADWRIFQLVEESTIIQNFLSFSPSLLYDILHYWSALFESTNNDICIGQCTSNHYEPYKRDDVFC
jgi:hypothetical protein